MCVCVLGIKKKKSLPPDVDCNEDDGNSGHEHGAKYRDDIDDSLGRITRWLPWWRRRFNFNSICQKKKQPVGVKADDKTMCVVMLLLQQ